MNKAKVIVAISGASGSLYARRMLEKLKSLDDQIEDVGVVMSSNAKEVWEFELGSKSYEDLGFKIYDNSDFFAPFASGSADYDVMIACPCSMGMLARIASGHSNDLISRAADVILKERRKLILVLRDTPYNLIHIRNMEQVTLAGGIIAPASPSFYSKPENFIDLADTVVDRVLSLAGFELKRYRWGSPN